MWRIVVPLLPLLLNQCTGWREAGLGSSNATQPGAGTSDGAIVGAAAAGLTAHELATGATTKVVFGWQLEVAGGRARFYACEDETTCGMRRVEVPASEITATSVVGRTRTQQPDGQEGEQDVIRLTLRHPLARTSRAGEVYDENHGLVFGGKGQ